VKHLPLYPNGTPSPTDNRVPAPSSGLGCTACELSSGAKYAPLANYVLGRRMSGGAEKGAPSVAVVFEAPTRGEDAGGDPFSSATYRTLVEIIRASSTHRVVPMYAVHCAPGNAEVTAEHVTACRGHLHETIAQGAAAVHLIIAVGPLAHIAVLGRKVAADLVPNTVSVIDAFWAKRVPVICLPAASVLRKDPARTRWRIADAIETAQNVARSIHHGRLATTFVQSYEDHLRVLGVLKKADALVFDTETVGRLHTPTFYVEELSFAVNDSNAVTYGRDVLGDRRVRSDLKALLENHAVCKVGHNIKYDLLALRTWLNVHCFGHPLRDTRLDHKLLHADSVGDLATCAEMVGFGGHKEEARAAIDVVKHDLNALASAPKRALTKSGKPRKPPTLKYLDESEVDPEHLEDIQQGADTEAYAQAYIPWRIRARYNALDAMSTYWLDKLNADRFDMSNRELSEGRMAVANEIVRPAISALVEMEATGIRVDTAALDIFTQFLKSEIAVVQSRLNHYPGVNFASPKQLAELLYDKLGLPVLAETPSGGRATGEEVLLELAEKTKHPLPKDVLAFRELEKLLGTYAEGMKKHIRVGPNGPRIHPSTLLDGAGTGRLSSQNPNMQNVPSPDRDTPGRPAFGKMARDIFVADPGCVLLEVDMSQQELRIAGMLSGDPVILECYKNNEDIHRGTAAIVYGVPLAAVTKEQRARSKTVTFGLVYGKTDRGLAKQLNITVAEAVRIRKAVLGRFKKLAEFCERCLASARRDGGAYTWWNGHERARWRPLPAINDMTDEGFGARINAENAAVNTPVQGLAADIVTASLFPIVARFRKDNLDAQLVNTVHDSVMINVREDQLPLAAKIMREVMLGHNTNGFPLGVDMKVGKSWGSMTEYHLPG